MGGENREYSFILWGGLMGSEKLLSAGSCNVLELRVSQKLNPMESNWTDGLIVQWVHLDSMEQPWFWFPESQLVPLASLGVIFECRSGCSKKKKAPQHLIHEDKVSRKSLLRISLNAIDSLIIQCLLIWAG